MKKGLLAVKGMSQGTGRDISSKGETLWSDPETLCLRVWARQADASVR